MSEGLTESQFYMWRTLFAMSHVDGVVTDQEIRFMVEAMEDIPFSAEQKAMLNEDIKNPRDVVKMFTGITNVKDQAKFFKFAHDLVWSDGEYGRAEQEMMLKLNQVHIRNANVDDLIDNVELQFEDDTRPDPSKTRKKDPLKKKALIFSFREDFLHYLFNSRS